MPSRYRDRTVPVAKMQKGSTCHLPQVCARVEAILPTPRQGLTRMPGILSLFATSCFERSKPDVSTCLVICAASSQARDSHTVSHPGVSHPGCTSSARGHTLAHPSDEAIPFKEFCQRNASPPIRRPGTLRVEAHRDADSPRSTIAEPKSTPTPSLPSETRSFSERTYVRSPDPLTSTRDRSFRSTSDDSTSYLPPATRATTLSESDDNDQSSYRRSHAIIAGRLIPVTIPCKDRLSAKMPNNPAATDDPEREQMEVAVGARPLLHTMQGFPFDLRRSRHQPQRRLEPTENLEKGR